MAQPVFWLISIFFFLSPKLGAAPLCEDLKGLQCEQAPWYLKAHVSLCQVQNQALKCDRLAAEGRIDADKLRTCSPYETCRKLTFQSDFGACAKAFQMTIDEYTELAKSVVDGWNKLSASASQNWAARNQFITSCNRSLECKRSLASEHPNFAQWSDEKLNKVTAAFLWVETQSYKAYKAGLERHSVPAKTPLERFELAQQKNQALSVAESGPNERALVAGAAQWLLDNGHEYLCYSPEAQTELQCYAAFMIIDPLIALKLASRTPWAASVIAKSLNKGGKDRLANLIERRGHISDEVSTGVRTVDRQNFINLYEKLEFTSLAENKKWMQLALSKPTKTRKFIDIENSKLKILNDKIKDKSLVTALTNLHKEMVFEELSKFSVKYPKLKFSPYSDFKSVRIAIDGDLDSETVQALEQALKNATQRFYTNPTVKGMLRADDLDGNWFKAGISSSADRGTSASRYGRQESGFRLVNFDEPAVQNFYAKSLERTESLRKELTSSLGETKAVVTKNVNGKSVQALDRLALDLARKSSNAGELADALKGQYGLNSLPDSAAQKLREYVNEIDNFSPGIFAAERTFVTFDDAVHGGISVDFVGMGSRNLEATADALMNARTVGEAIEVSRRNERLVTTALDEERLSVQADMTDIFSSRGALRTACSGDDCGGVALRQPWTDQQKIEYVKRRALEGPPSQYRIAFFSEGIPEPAHRGMMVTHGESIEKLLRQRLSRIVERRRLEGLTFAVDMKGSQVGQGGVRLIVGRGQNVNLSQIERTNLDLTLRHAIRDLNEQLRSAGLDANYRAIDLVIP